MKTLFLLLILALYSNVFSQITLTASNNPVPGNSMRSIFCDTTLVQGNSGANQSWNFSVISFLDSSYQNWVNSSSTPYSAQFPLSNIAAQADNEDSYTYFATSTSGMTENGYGGTGNILLYSDPKTILQYPFTYNSSFSDNFIGVQTGGGFDIYRQGTISAVCDAWGTLTLPTGTYNNAIRIRYDFQNNDSSSAFTSVFNATYYQWYVSNTKFPVIEIRYTNFSFNGVPVGSNKFVWYNPNNPSIGITQINSNVADNFKLSQNYPNPFNPSTKIKFDVTSGERNGLSKVYIVVYDQLGKQVAALVNDNFSPGSYEVDWNAADLPGGTYFYRMTSGDFTETKKMILIK
ncbi:MAG: T9SS type A sorting domain-containing protein [Ignavibacteria bacterium]